jgi:hypothetical protein
MYRREPTFLKKAYLGFSHCTQAPLSTGRTCPTWAASPGRHTPVARYHFKDKSAYRANKLTETLGSDAYIGRIAYSATDLNRLLSQSANTGSVILY